MNRCKKCNIDFKEEKHYCPNCGRNLSGEIEKTDLCSFFSVFFIVVGILGGSMFFGAYALASVLISVANAEGENVSSPILYGILIVIVTILFIGFGIFLGKKEKELRKKNIENLKK